jgi:uncharacterized membrane protein
MILPGIGINLLTNYPAQLSTLYHYDLVISVGIFLSAMIGFKRLTDLFNNRGWSKYVKLSLIIVILLVYFNLLTFLTHPLWAVIKKNDYRTDDYNFLMDVRSKLPSSISLGVTNAVGAFFADREKLYVLNPTIRSYPNLPDFVIIDTSTIIPVENSYLKYLIKDKNYLMIKASSDNLIQIYSEKYPKVFN